MNRTSKKNADHNNPHTGVHGRCLTTVTGIREQRSHSATVLFTILRQTAMVRDSLCQLCLDFYLWHLLVPHHYFLQTDLCSPRSHPHRPLLLHLTIFPLPRKPCPLTTYPQMRTPFSCKTSTGFITGFFWPATDHVKYLQLLTVFNICSNCIQV